MKTVHVALVLLLASPATANEAKNAAVGDCEARGHGTRDFCTRMLTGLEAMSKALGRDAQTACMRTPNGYSGYDVCMTHQTSAGHDILGAVTGDLFISQHREAIQACMRSANSPVEARDCMVERMPDYMAAMRVVP